MLYYQPVSYTHLLAGCTKMDTAATTAAPAATEAAAKEETKAKEKTETAAEPEVKRCV